MPLPIHSQRIRALSAEDPQSALVQLCPDDICAIPHLFPVGFRKDSDYIISDFSFYAYRVSLNTSPGLQARASKHLKQLWGRPIIKAGYYSKQASIHLLPFLLPSDDPLTIVFTVFQSQMATLALNCLHDYPAYIILDFDTMPTSIIWASHSDDQ